MVGEVSKCIEADFNSEVGVLAPMNVVPIFFGTARLASLRASRPDAAYVGGFGWVEDLRPGTARGSDGYIHTPSMAQGTAATASNQTARRRAGVRSSAARSAKSRAGSATSAVTRRLISSTGSPGSEKP